MYLSTAYHNQICLLQNEVCFRKTLLVSSTNFHNRRPIFIKKRLPKFDRDNQNEASEDNLVITTRNSEVRVFVKKPNNQVQTFGIKGPQILKDLAPRADQSEKQHANRTKRTLSIGSGSERYTNTNNERIKRPNYP